MPTYESAQFEPPAPVARITLRNTETGDTRDDVPMLLDTGADVTLIPREVVSKLGVVIVPDKYYELVAFDGTVSLASVVKLELIFCRRTFRGQFLLIDQQWGVIGRNVLNRVSVLFDGPNLIWNESRRES